MKRVVLVAALLFIVVFISILIIKDKKGEEGDTPTSKKTEARTRQNLKLSEEGKGRFEKLGLVIKQAKRLPFNPKANKPQEKSLSDTGSIVGIITNEEGKPLKGCLITLLRAQEGFTSARKSDLSGKFFFDKIGTGVYNARIVCQDFRMEREGITVEKDRITELNIVAQKNEQTSTATISGNIIDFITRSPVVDATVEFVSENERSSQVHTDQIGRFSINVRYPQKGRLIINKDGYIRKEVDVETKESELNLNNIVLVLGNIKNDGSKYQGIGAALIAKNGEFVVAQVFDGTPAHKAGLMKNDKITQINGMDISSLKLDELIALIRGDERTNVILTIKRGDSIQHLQIVREIIEIK